MRAVDPPIAPEIELAEDVELTVRVELFATEPPMLTLPVPELMLRVKALDAAAV